MPSPSIHTASPSQVRPLPHRSHLRLSGTVGVPRRCFLRPPPDRHDPGWRGHGTGGDTGTARHPGLCAAQGASGRQSARLRKRRIARGGRLHERADPAAHLTAERRGRHRVCAIQPCASLHRLPRLAARGRQAREIWFWFLLVHCMPDAYDRGGRRARGVLFLQLPPPLDRLLHRASRRRPAGPHPILSRAPSLPASGCDLPRP
eukprot:scaffold31427_cov95-Isochrysis_galbana.AAC.1